MDPYLESWEWTVGRSDRFFNTAEEGWVVTSRGQMSPTVEYRNERLAGANGYYLGLGLAGGLELEATFTYGDHDPLDVAKKVSQLFSTLVLGGSPLLYKGRYRRDDGNLRMKPYGSKAWWGVNAALQERRVEYSEHGCIADVSLKWVCPKSVWVLSREDPDPSGLLVGSEAGQPW